MKYYNDSDEMLAEMEFVIEATSCEQHFLWEKHHERLSWSGQRSGGFLLTLGVVDEMPVCISIEICVLNGRSVLFFEPTSMLVDYRLVEDKFKGYTIHDANNFHSLMLDVESK